MRARWLLVLLALALPSLALERVMTDDFARYPAGGDASPAWEAGDVGWSVDQGLVGDGGYCVWRAAPYAASGRFACDLTVLGPASKDDWLTAGIGFNADDRNWWAVNLVAAPEAQGRKHYAELHEGLNGAWLAENNAGTRLTNLGSKGNEFNWQEGVTYRFELDWTPDTVTASIRRGAEVVAQFGYQLPAGVPAVRVGRPTVRAGGLRTRFTRAEFTLREQAPDPVVQRPVIPPWQSRPGQPLAKGTGFFRTAQVDGRWWLVDPEGKPFFDVGTDHINYNAHWCEKLGYAPYHKNVAAKYGSEEAWAKVQLQRLKDWGFNTLPAGHSPLLRHRGLAHILFASFGSGFAKRSWIAEPIHWTGFPDVFDPQWPAYCRTVARRMAQESQGDPWLIGTFLDNELEWYGKKGALVDDVFKLGADRPAKQALYAWLLQRYGSLAALNTKLGTHYADRDGFLKDPSVPIGPEMQAVHDGFLAEIADHYFKESTTALRAADPDHLVMGCRFAGRAPEPALPAAGKYNDVFTINTYPRVDFQNTWLGGGGGTVEGTPQQLVDYFKVVNKPMIITEWSFPALDSGLPCKHGAGMRVDTQEQKALCYQIFANMVSDLPFMVGYHYFMYIDEPALGISSTFPEDSNYGLVNEQDEPYPALTAMATRVNCAAADRHARSSASGDLEIHVVGGSVQVRNPDKVASHGQLWIGSAAAHRVEQIALGPGQAKAFRVPADGLWYAELQRWDGTRQRIVGTPVAAGEVANVSAQTLKNLPVVLDGEHPATAWLSELGPGGKVKLSAPAGEGKEVDRLNLTSGDVTWRSQRKDGSLFDGIEAGGLPLGRLLFATHQRVGGQDQWVEADKVASLKLVEQPDAWVVEAVLERSGGGETITAVDAQGNAAGSTTPAARFRAGVRAVVFKQGGLALVKPLWIASLDQRPWQLVDAFLFCRPAIGGSPDDDGPGGPDVPNYYLRAQFWTDSKLGGAFGAAASADDWRVNFFKDAGGGFHPDAYRPIDQPMAWGTRWKDAGASYLWVYGSRNPSIWRTFATRADQAGTSLLLGQASK